MEINFKERLTELRQEKGLSQEDLGELTGIHSMNISKWERGIILPSITSVITLAKFFNVSTDYLLGLDEN
jgi:transcriptional regulator with XRE-family HTH domain